MVNKKIKSAGRFRAGFGVRAKKKLIKVEEKQRKKQPCPYCRKKGVERLASGLWLCHKCKKKFASHAYYLK